MSAVRKTREWTPAQRQAQGDKLRARKIWLASTGPTSPQGKKTSSRNALKHGLRSEAVRRFHNLCRLLDLWRKNYNLIRFRSVKVPNELIDLMNRIYQYFRENGGPITEDFHKTLSEAGQRQRTRAKKEKQTP